MLVLFVKYCCFIVINVSELCSAISGVPFPLPNASDSFAESHNYQPLIDRPSIVSSVKWSGGNASTKRETTATKGLRLHTHMDVA